MGHGTYVAVKVLDPSRERILEFIKKHGIPQTYEDRQGLHATILWSVDDHPLMKPVYDAVHRARSTGYTIYRSNGKERLVMMLDSTTLSARHEQLLREHGARYRYEKYNPHVTIAYDVGTFKWWNLPPFTHDILLGDENIRAGNDRTITTNEPWKRLQKILSEIA